MTYHVGANPFGPARSGTLTVAGRPFTVEQLGTPPNGLVTAGAMAHLASGGGWKTTFTLVNNGSATAQTRLSFTSSTGANLTLPVTFPQTGSGPILASTLERDLNAGETVIFEWEGPITQDAYSGEADH